MEKRKLGTTDIEVTSICLGTMNFGNGQCDEKDAHEQLSYAVDRGVNFIDTAESYPIPPRLEIQGNTESYVGNWIKRRGRRDDFILASKIAGRVHTSTMRLRDVSEGLSRKNVRSAVEGSLRRLQTDYIDVYQVHVPDRKINNFGLRNYGEDYGFEGAMIEETLRGLDDMVKEGKIRAIGVSNESPWGVNEYLRLSREKGLHTIATIQNQYSLLNRTYEIGLSEIGIREHVSLLAYSPLSMGALTGKYLYGARPEGARHVMFVRNEDRYNPPRAQAAIERYVELAKKYATTPSTFAIAFAASRPFVASAIIGATTMTQLKEDIDGGDFVWTPEMEADVHAVYNDYPDPVA